MIQEIRFSDEFLKAFKKRKKRYKSLPQDVDDKRATTMLQLLLASGLFTLQKTGMDLAMEDIAKGRYQYLFILG